MDEDTTLSLELIRALDEAIATGNWEGGLFFQAAGKKLRDLSDELKKEFHVDTEAPITPEDFIDYAKQKSGLIEIYISIYCAEGTNIRKWEAVLANLSKQIIGRPIYKREKDIKEAIQAKGNPINDAYVIAYVTEMDILKPSFREKLITDRYGHELLRLNDNALKIDSITKFVHLTGEYTYRKNQLIRL